MLVYCAARLYTLNGLADYATGKMELFGKDLSIFQILDITDDVYPKLLEDETWFPEYLKTQVEDAFNLDETIFAQEKFLDYIGRAPAFSKALAKIMVEIFTNKRIFTSKKGSGMYQNRQDMFEGYIAEKPVLPEVSAKEGLQEEAHVNILPDENFGACLPSPPPPPHSEDGPMPSEEGKADPQGEVPEHYFPYNGLEECVPPPLPPEEQIATAELTHQGLGSDGSWDGIFPWPKTKAQKEKPMRKEDVDATKKELQSLNGRRIKKTGRILGDNLLPIGRLVEGDAKRLNKLKATCDNKGNVWHLRKVVGKVELLLPEEGEGQTGAPILAEESLLCEAESDAVPCEDAVPYEEDIPCEDAVPYDGDVLCEDAVLTPLSPGSSIEPNLCSYQVQHMHDGSWKSCRHCRALIRNLSIQLLHKGNRANEAVRAVG